ncbi:MAG: hypothetical protein WA210_23175 [Burkholderiaceae bacterium]
MNESRICRSAKGAPHDQGLCRRAAPCFGAAPVGGPRTDIFRRKVIGDESCRLKTEPGVSPILLNFCAVGRRSDHHGHHWQDPATSQPGLRIATLGFGLRGLSNSSVELLHDYRRAVASTRLAGSRLSQAPEGLNRGIGREIDLLFAMREWRHIELTLLLARFRPGAAFATDRRDPANMIEIGATPTF